MAIQINGHGTVLYGTIIENTLDKLRIKTFKRVFYKENLPSAKLSRLDNCKQFMNTLTIFAKTTPFFDKLCEKEHDYLNIKIMFNHIFFYT